MSTIRTLYRTSLIDSEQNDGYNDEDLNGVSLADDRRTQGEMMMVENMVLDGSVGWDALDLAGFRRGPYEGHQQ